MVYYNTFYLYPIQFYSIVILMSKPDGGCKQYSRNKNKCLGIGCTWCSKNFRNKCRWKPGYFACSGKITQRGLAGANAVGNRYSNYVNNVEKKENNATKLTFPGFIIQTIYKKLFSTRTEEGKTTKSPVTLKVSNIQSCFEDGAFLFEDNDGALFNILAYGDVENKQGLDRAKPSGRNILSGETFSTPLTHLMPYLAPFKNENKLQVLLQKKIKPGTRVEKITFTFHNLSGREPELTLLTQTTIPEKHWLKVKQYEREIGNPKIKIDCGYDNGETTKGVIKFYSYSINEHYSRFGSEQAKTVTKRFTYVKLESKSMKDLSGKAHHAAQNLKKKFPKTKSTKGENQNSLISPTSTSLVGCYQKQDKNTCYRAEDVVDRPDDDEYADWVKTYNPGEEDYYKDYRVGAEYFVPQETTAAIVEHITRSDLRSFSRIINPDVMPRESLRTKRVGGKRKTRKRRKKKTRRKKRDRKKRTRKR